MRTVLVAVCALALVSCGGDSGGGAVDAVGDTTPTSIATPTTATTTTTLPPTTTETPTTVAARTGGVQSCTGEQVFDDHDGDGWGICNTPTTTIDPADEGDLNVVLAGSNVIAKKADLAGILEDADMLTESVDLVDFDIGDDPPSATMKIAVTTGFNGIEYRDESAWTIARLLGTFWSADDGAFLNPDGVLKTGLELTVDTTVYVASYDLMVAVDSLSITSTEWLNSTRKG